MLIPWDMDYYDASNFMDVFVTGGRHAWSNPDYDTLVKEADGIVGDEGEAGEALPASRGDPDQGRGRGLPLAPRLYPALEAVHCRGHACTRTSTAFSPGKRPEKGPQYYCTYFTNEKPA